MISIIINVCIVLKINIKSQPSLSVDKDQLEASIKMMTFLLVKENICHAGATEATIDVAEKVPIFK